ncbi:MAG: dual specificity protein phosphatase family protein [Deltaproteobacteria bacterium]
MKILWLFNCGADRKLSCLGVLLILVFLSGAATAAPRLSNFTSDGCMLFPDGPISERGRWCECCLNHDIAYWRGGTKNDRLKADEELKACVLERTKDKTLSETMYLGVRAGGHPAFPTWYRWAYGWSYGRGYAPLTDSERRQVKKRLDEYYQKHPAGFCGKEHLGSIPTAKTGTRPANWAAPVPSEHLKNFYKLDDKVYRSAQPNEKGFRELKTFGIRNVLSFRDYHSDDEAEGTHLRLFRVKMDAGDFSDEQVIEALRIIRNAEGPILIHCWHGSDRTGLISAMYRIVFQGWSKEDAIDELMNGGYGYHSLFYKNIPEYIRTVDIEKVKKEVQAP